MLVITGNKCQKLLIHLITILEQEAVGFVRPHGVAARWDGQTNKPSAVFTVHNKEEDQILLPEQKYFCHLPDV